MPETDLADQLRRYAEAAEAAVPVSSQPAPTAAPASGARWRTHHVGLAAVVVVIAAIVSTALWVGRDDGGVADVTAGRGRQDVVPPGWSTIPAAPIAGRIGAAAVVAGDELLVWSGRNQRVLADGAAYSITDGTWRVLPAAPLTAREEAVVAWTGTEMLVLGGYDENLVPQLDGAAYSPAEDRWRRLPPLEGEANAFVTGAAWTGEELVLVGVGGSTAWAYDPTLDRWRAVDVAAGPVERLDRRRRLAAVWTGSEVLVVTIADGQGVTIDRVEPITGQWADAVITTVPGLDTDDDAVVWTGAELLIIGHYTSGARFDPSLGVVRELPPSNATATPHFPAVVAGSAVVVGDRWLDLATMTWQDGERAPGPFREFPAAAGDGVSAFYWGGNACGAGAVCAGVVDPGIGLRWVPPQAAGSAREPDRAQPTLGPEVPEAGLGPDNWRGARTGRDGPSLLVTFLGRPPYRADDPCSTDYTLEAVETSEEVRVRILAVVRESTGDADGVIGCSAAGYPRAVEAVLAEPLGDRRVVDAQFERPRAVFDGTRLAVPTFVPEGWSTGTEGPGYPGPGTGLYWTRSWSPERVVSAGGCVADDSGLRLTEGPAALVDVYEMNGATPQGTHDVNGAVARYSTSDDGSRYLSWVQGDRGFVVATAPACSGDTLASLEAMLRFARGLDTAPGSSGEG